MVDIKELDRITTEGLRHIETLINAPSVMKENTEAQTAHDKAVERAAFTALKLFDSATRRMSAMTNRAAVGLKIAKSVGLEGDALLPIWSQISPAEQVENDRINELDQRGAKKPPAKAKISDGS